jgi:hypothetical protein
MIMSFGFTEGVPNPRKSPSESWGFLIFIEGVLF